MKAFPSNIITAIAVFLMTVFSACTKEWEPETDGVHITKMRLRPSDGGSALRSSIDETATAGIKNVKWAAADEIYYWTCKTVNGNASAASDKQKHTVLADTEEEEIPVTYRDNDEYVTFYTAGKSVSLLSLTNMTTMQFRISQQQDGTFASNHFAVYKSKVILNTSVAVMKPVASMIRFTLSTLTYGGRTVDNIRIGCMDGGFYVWGDLDVTMNNTTLGNISAVERTANTGDSNPIIIDKRSSAFQTGIPYYVALRPRTTSFTNGIYFDLYNGNTKLARVVVKDSGGNFTLPYGTIRDIGDLKAHARIPTTAEQMTIYPPYAAITKDLTKKFWLRVEPSDFSGEIEWKVTKTDGNATGDFTIEAGSSKEDVTIDGQTVSCWTATVKPATGVEDYTARWGKVTATAKVKGESNVTKSVQIEMGRFVDIGCEDASGNRVLWANGDMQGAYDKNHWNYGTETYDASTCTLLMNTDWGTTGGYWWFGYLCQASMVSGGYHRWEADKTAANQRKDGSGGKYYSPEIVEVADEDNVAKYMYHIYPEYTKTEWDIPKAVDYKVMMSSCTRTGGTTGSSYTRFTPNYFAFSDCYVRLRADRAYLCKDGLNSPTADGNGSSMVFNVTAGGANIYQNAKEDGGAHNYRLRLIRRVPK